MKSNTTEMHPTRYFTSAAGYWLRFFNGIYGSLKMQIIACHIKKLVFLVLFVLTATSAFANNIYVSNVVLTGKNTTADYAMIRVDLSWENSWRNSTGAPQNWDAAWVLIKYKVGTGNWQHATLNTTISNHVAPTGSTITTPGDGAGAFIYRSTDGTGTFSLSDVRLRWEYGVNGVGDNDQVQLKVFAVEMVYVPQGSFYVGSGGASTNEFYAYPNTASAYQINSENAITVGTATGNLFYPADNTTSGDRSGPIPAAYPKGYNAFYCMKYEVTQGQYRDFLNTLTYTQQTARTATAPNSASGTGALHTSNANRNGLDIQTPGVSATLPAVYGCNLDNDAVFNESTDGEWVACNWVSWQDVCGYLDWAGLRPMTELEYEKGCRGGLTPVASEYAWGSTAITAATGITNGGATNETYSNSGATCAYNNTITGPLRVGVFAKSTTTRASAGATYWGIMEMSGNLWERVVSIGNATARAYTGTHGDGTLSATGNANQLSWPGLVSGEVTGAVGSGFRGSGWNVTTSARLQVSNREFGASEVTDRATNRGIRGVRTAP